MLIAQRHPVMKTALRNESGVIGTYAMAVLAVLCSLVGAALFVGKTPARDVAASVSLFSAETGPAWVDDGLTQRQAGTEQSAAAARAAAAGTPLEIKGADLDADQPFYDEAAGVAISTR
jgi:hypothetical protein